MRHASLTTAQVFERDDMESMTREERRFAEEQLRNIFSHEMSKVSLTMDKKRQVSSKLLELEHLQEDKMQRTFDRLQQRMNNVDNKRKEQLRKRIESCRSHDEHWRNKMTEIDKRIRQENRAAFQKVTKYNEEQDSFLQKRHTQASNLHLRRSSDSHHDRTLPIGEIQRYSTQFLQRSPTSKFAPLKDGKMPPLSMRLPIQSPRSNKNLLDESIRTHRIRSRRLQKEKDDKIFQKALVRLDTITQRRKKMLSLHQEDKKTDDTMQSRRRLQERSPSGITERSSISPKDRVHSSTMVMNRDLNRAPHRQFDHIAVKKRRELKEFTERGQILQKNILRNKKEHILRQIRQKVIEYKRIAQRSN